MKKLGIIGGIVVLLFVLVIVLTNMQNKSKLENNPYDKDDLNQATIDILDDPNYQGIIVPSALEDKIASGEATLAYLFSPLCSHCQNFTPKLMKVANENNLSIDKLNVLEYEDAWNQYRITGTPTLIYFEDGIEVARLDGDQPEEEVQAFFDENVLN